MKIMTLVKLMHASLKKALKVKEITAENIRGKKLEPITVTDEDVKQYNSRNKRQIFLAIEKFNGGAWFDANELLSLKYTIDTALQNMRKVSKETNFKHYGGAQDE